MPRTRHTSEPSDGKAVHAQDTLAVLSEASRALSNPRLHEEEQEEEATVYSELNLSQQEMVEFNLREGLNEAVFSVTTQFQGNVLIHKVNNIMER